MPQFWPHICKGFGCGHLALLGCFHNRCWLFQLKRFVNQGKLYQMEDMLPSSALTYTYLFPIDARWPLSITTVSTFHHLLFRLCTYCIFHWDALNISFQSVSNKSIKMNINTRLSPWLMTNLYLCLAFKYYEMKADGNSFCGIGPSLRSPCLKFKPLDTGRMFWSLLTFISQFWHLNDLFLRPNWKQIRSFRPRRPSKALQNFSYTFEKHIIW